MSIFKRISANAAAEKAFNNALDEYSTLRRYPVNSGTYREALTRVIDFCVEAICNNNRQGDAHILLSNAYFLYYIDVNIENTDNTPLFLAAAVIKHWFDEPMRQYPWTKNVNNGHRIFEQVANALAENAFINQSNMHSVMNDLKVSFYSIAISPE